MKRILIYIFTFLLLSSFAFSQPVDHTSDTVIAPQNIAFGGLCGLTAASVPYAGAGGCLEEENANFFYTAATDLLTVTNVKALTNFFLLDDNAIFFDTAASKSLLWDSTNTNFQFNDSLVSTFDAGDTVFTAFSVHNTNEGLTGETTQGIQINLVGTGTSDSGSTYTDEIYGYIRAEKQRDFFGAAASEADFDSRVDIGVMVSGSLSDRIQMSDTQIFFPFPAVGGSGFTTSIYTVTGLASAPAAANRVHIGYDMERHEGPTSNGFETKVVNDYPDPTSVVSINKHNPVAYSGLLVFNDHSIMTFPRGLWVWDTDPGAGTQADYSGNSHIMTFNGTVATNDLQLVNQGLVYWLVLNGSDNYISTPDHANFSYALTAVSWEFVIDVTATAAVQIIWSKWDETTAAEDREWRIYLTALEELVIEFYDETPNVSCNRTSSSPLSVGVHHIVIEYDGGGGATAADGITMYSGGAVEASAATNNGSFVQMRADSTPVWIGAQENTVGAAELFFQSKIGIFGVTQESYDINDVFKLWLNARWGYAL